MPAAANPRPNIVVILADDMAYSDPGCYGSEIRTPSIDRLARGGARFSQMYNCARCCPTRASLLTGLHPHQAGIGLMTVDWGSGPYQGYLNKRCVTIAEALKPAGYRTLMAGKWHVGGQQHPLRPEEWLADPEKHPTPLDRGFDRFYGTLEGYVNFFNPHTLVRDRSPLRIHNPGYYYTDAITDEAVGMVDDALREPEPFFLYYCHCAPHWPLHALPEDIERYRGKYLCGWDVLRERRAEELRSLGIFDGQWRVTPRDANARPWEEARHKEWEDLRMAVYAAQIDRMDQGIGRLVAKLEEHGALDNTLLLFLSDNGGCAEFLAENGGPDSDLLPPVDGRPLRIGNSPGILPGDADTFASYEMPWANAGNTPFRLYKHWVHEGGIATPMVAHWPGHIEPGARIHRPSHVMDILPTCLEAARAEYPKEYGGLEITPVEGESLVPCLEGRSDGREGALCFEHLGNRAVRRGPWKLVSEYPGGWELYNMEEDRVEMRDLVGRNHAVRVELEMLYEEWEARCEVIPRNPETRMRKVRAQESKKVHYGYRWGK